MSRRERDRDPNRISLLIRNLPLDCRADDVRYKFEKYGEIRDVYLPKDYYTGRPRGFGFLEYRDPRDAEEALYHLDRSIFMGREITVVMSKESRKTPRDMIQRERTTGGSRGSDRHDDRRGSRSPRRRYSRSRSPRRRSRSRTPPRRDSPSPRRHVDERPASPPPGRADSPRGRSRSPAGGGYANGGADGGRSPPRGRSRSASPGGRGDRSPPPRSPADSRGDDY